MAQDRLTVMPQEISKAEASDLLLRVADLEKRLQKAERERDELLEVAKAAGTTLTGGWADIIADISRDALELRSLRALIRWVTANPSRCIGNCCGELGAFTVYHASAEDDISEDGSGPTAVALADALGLEWRE